MKQYLKISPAVQKALDEDRPVIALESTIISHGMPYPQNLETARLCEAEARKNGAEPATIAVIGGKLCAGLTDEELEYLARTGPKVTKASRRDLPILCARGADGATTVAATMIVAAMAGIKVFATGTAEPRPPWISPPIWRSCPKPLWPWSVPGPRASWIWG